MSQKIRIARWFILSLTLIAGSAGAKTSLENKAGSKPAVSVWNYDHMLGVRGSLQKGEDTYKAPYQKLIQEAQKMLDEPATSVMDKADNKVAVSGDKHDFISVGKYCWPNPNTPDGMPWIQRDGYINEENFKKDDAVRQDKMCNNVIKLSLAWFFSGDNRYAAKAVELSRVWFIDPATRMNPHMTYAQVIPGNDNNMGHFPGIIFGRVYTNLLAGISLLKNSPAYTTAVDTGIKKWFGEYTNWLLTSEFGIKEGKMTNNHSIAYDQQLLAFALFAGDNATGRKIVSEVHPKRIFQQVEPDGKMPRELSRTRGLGYSVYNVKHMLEICEMAKEINPSLFSEQSPDGRSIGKAIEFVAGYLGKTVADFAPYKQIDDWDKCMDELCWIVKWTQKYDPSKNYNLMFQKCVVNQSDNMIYLLY